QNKEDALFPADAGMYRVITASSGSSATVPRRRGDVPKIQALSQPGQPCSPQTRGCTGWAVSLWWGGGLFPADAGMYRLTGATPLPRGPVPRRRGDVPGCLWRFV